MRFEVQKGSPQSGSNESAYLLTLARRNKNKKTTYRGQRRAVAAAAILKTSFPSQDSKRECGTSTVAHMAAKNSGSHADTERARNIGGGTNSDHGRHQQGRPIGRQQLRSPSVPPSPAAMGRATDSQESLRSCHKVLTSVVHVLAGVGSEHGFRHLFDSCAHCDWIWKGDACDIFYRELAESQTESITYELASRPDPGLFARFFADKGYQKGRAVQDSDKTAAASSSSPTRGTWASDADWRAQISNLATHEKRTRKSAKMLLAQQALNRLRHWTSGHHHHHHAMTTDNGGSPLRQDLMDDAKSTEEAKTLLRRPREEDCSEVRKRTVPLRS
ncbi:uncharacterized protein LOC119405533 [Rhipicephalus sanguineus]|uniref:uncharacterized protein LOC119405533 n=1 Tax=Rhipicephalus sanguineus TaxID=34632 RepID=UPI0020C59A26|nr:uncharacterized protein LOC119405533 [Rhipicephalus sanguineus]